MNSIQTLTVYLGSSGRTRPVFKQAAKELGTLIGQNNKALVYGGMDAGLMGIVANNALKSVAQVTGIIPKQLKDSERIHPHLTETILVQTLWERKLKMFKRADAIIGLPGGFGTLDECLEVLYWGYLRLHNKPLVLVNIEEYWTPIIDYLRMLSDFDPRYLIVTETVEDIFYVLERWSSEGLPAPKPDGYTHFEEEILGTPDQPLVLDNATVAETYKLITALGLKQLGKHNRPIGILNDQKQFDDLLRWIDSAAAEHFLTDQCKYLFSTSQDPETLSDLLAAQDKVTIDLHADKWGPGETEKHLEIKEKK